MGSCLKNIDVMSIDVRKRSFLPLRAALIENCTSSLLQKTLTMMPNIQMHLLQKGDVSFKETQIAFWRISLSIKEKESNMAMILPLNVVARLALYSI